MTNCSNIIVDNERGSIICLDTGEVIEENYIAMGPDWRAYSAEEWLKRAHASNTTYRAHDSGLVTDIDLTLSVKRYREYVKNKKLWLLQRKTRVDKSERKLVEALSHLNQMVALLNLPSHAAETAALVLRKIFSILQPRVDKLKILALASIVIACRKHGIPIRVRELLTRFGIDEE